LKSFFTDIFRRNVYILLTAFGLFLTGYFLNLYFSGDASVRRLRNSIQSFLQERERDFDELSKDTSLMTRLAEKQYTEKDLDRLVNKKYGFFLYGPDSVGAGLYLQFWNDQRSLPTMALINGPDTAGFIRLSNGQYGYIKRTAFDSDRKPHLAIALIPVRWQYYITLSNLSPEFVDFPLAEKRVEIVFTPTDLPVVDYRGSTLFYLARKAGYQAPAHIWPIPMMILLGVLLMLIIIHNIAHAISERWGTWWGISFLVATIVLMRAIVYLAPGLLDLRQFELFDPTIYSSGIILNSLGDLVINSFLFCWIIMFIRRELADYTIPQSVHRWKNWLLMSIGLALLVLTTFLFANVVQSLVTDAKISFNVTNFFSLLKN
jgi:two-component system, NtrC family, nitrogen regulation sensor histidine kinase NtrY